MILWRKLIEHRELQDPAFVRYIFSNVQMAGLWAAVRIYLGWQWLDAGRHKLTAEGWTGGGDSLRLFWERVVAVPEKGRPPINYGWYRDFLQFMLDHEWYTWFAWLVAVGETVVGIALILGVFTGFAALFGATMNFNFMLAGTSSTNPVLFGLALLLIMAWKTAGYIGVDRWLLPAVGTPWQPGALFERRERSEQQPHRA